MDELQELRDDLDQVIIDARNLALRFKSSSKQSAMDEVVAIIEEAKDILDHWEEDYEDDDD